MKESSLFLKPSLQLLIGSLWFSSAAAFAGGTNAPATSIAPSANAAPVGVKELLKNPKSYAGRPIVLEGLVTDVCKRKGCWALLHDTDPEAKGQIRVKQDDEAGTFKAFLPEEQGKTVLVSGELSETRIDADYLNKWEARVKAAGEAKTKDKEAEGTSEAVTRQITLLRQRLAKSTNGYLSSYGFAVTKWENKAEKP
jgi:hypothetical protein